MRFLHVFLQQFMEPALQDLSKGGLHGAGEARVAAIHMGARCRAAREGTAHALVVRPVRLEVRLVEFGLGFLRRT